MKKFIFISDFDGTMTERDFYHIVIDRYLGDAGKQLYHKWKAGEYKDVDFLGTVFQSMNRDENEIFQDILSIKLDEHIKEFVARVRLYGGEFLVLSAGTRYYIDILLQQYGMGEISVISNPGVYSNYGIHMSADRQSPFFSERYGVDKELVVKEYKKHYSKIYYAGDSEPDLKAALQADLIFAKGDLQVLLREKGCEFIPIASFKEIDEYLSDRMVSL